MTDEPHTTKGLLYADKQQLLDRMKNISDELFHLGMADVTVHMDGAISALRRKKSRKP